MTTIKKQNRTRKAVMDFIRQINSHNVDGLIRRITPDHQLIDAHGKVLTGIDHLRSGWIGYFQWFPDYKIEVESVLGKGNTLCVFGFAGGTFGGVRKADRSNSWKLPAAWKAVVKDGKISTWQVYCDTKLVLEILQRANSNM